MVSLPRPIERLALPDHHGARLRWLIAFILGFVSVVGLPPLALWPVYFVTLSGLVLLLDVVAIRWREDACRGRRLRAAAAVGWWFGFGYFLAGLYWIGFAFLVEAEKFAWLLPLAVTALPAGLAMFFALATTAAMAMWVPGIARVLILASALGVTEWLRGNILTGLPWNALGYALAGNELLLQTASLIGITGMSVVAVVVFGLPAAALGSAGRASRRPVILAPLAFSGALLAVMFAYGGWRLTAPEPPVQGTARLRLVQPNIPQADKWEGANRQRIFETFLDLSRRGPTGAATGFSGITHVVWPESSLPFLMLQSPEALKAIGDLLPPGVFLVTGSLRAQTGPDGAPLVTNGLYTIYNDIAVVDAEGRTRSVFDKIHLVPFGEYLPAQATLEWLGLEQLTRLKGGFAAGAGPRELSIPGLPPTVPLICYEAIFPEEIAPSPDQTWLLNVTNDAWFGRSAGPHQHLMQARARAVEQGLPLVRVANTGISAVISARGSVAARLELETRGVIDTPLPGFGERPLYARIGDAALAVLLVLIALTVAIQRRWG